MSDKSKIENKKITAAVQERAEQLRQKDVKELTIAEKMMIRGWEQRETIIFKSDMFGDIPVTVRIPLTIELEHLQKLQMRLAVASQYKKPDVKIIREAEESLDELYKIVADLCIDESLNYEFFKSGYFIMGDLLEIIMAVTKKKAAHVDDAAEFREE